MAFLPAICTQLHCLIATLLSTPTQLANAVSMPHALQGEFKHIGLDQLCDEKDRDELEMNGGQCPVSLSLSLS